MGSNSTSPVRDRPFRESVAQRMGIELRRGNPYFYRKVRRGGRVVSEYAGAGVLGLAGAMMAEDDRVERRREVELWRAERERMEDEDRAIAGDFDRVEVRVREVLAAAGYHRLRGEWRKRRG
jgi:hypothetical protein